MTHYRIYFLSPDGKIAGKPAELDSASDDEVIMRALMAERNTHGAEVWRGPVLVRRVENPAGQQQHAEPHDRERPARAPFGLEGLNPKPTAARRVPSA